MTSGRCFKPGRLGPGQPNGSLPAPGSSYRAETEIERESGIAIPIIFDTRATPKVKRLFERHLESHLHFTTKRGSWLNQAERSFAEITAERFRLGVFRNAAPLEMAIMEPLTHHIRASSAFRVDRQRGPDTGEIQERL